MSREAAQDDLFEAPLFSNVTLVSEWRKQRPLFVIGCSDDKTAHPSPAAELYRSRRFKLARDLAQDLSGDFLIFSAAHGLIAPEDTVLPYDKHLGALGTDELRNLIVRVAERLKGVTRPICVLANHEYAELFREAAQHAKRRVIAPLASVDGRYHMGWLEQARAYLTRLQDLEVMYQLLGVLRQRNAIFPLRNLPQIDLPKRGVYLFLDPLERSFCNDEPRIVRVGTHAVSQGSKSTLRTRLRNHLGQANGYGNHRGSIFRLHVGAAVLARDYESLPSWGRDQDAPKAIRNQEENHEQYVSNYLAGLEVAVIPIEDDASKKSLRAHVERQLISLLTENYQLIDRAGKDWLGKHSPTPSIERSGLWNIQYVGGSYRSGAPGDISQVRLLLTQD